MLVWYFSCYYLYWLLLIGFIVWMYYLISWWIYVMELYFPCMMWWWVLCWQYLILMCCMLGNVLPCLKTIGEIKCCVRFSVPRDPVKTLSPVWRSGKGSSSLVWSSGRELVRVLYSLACVKQWWGERCFTLFRLVASIVHGVRCINVFTQNSLRNKGDNLAVIVGHVEPFISRKLDVVVG